MFRFFGALPRKEQFAVAKQHSFVLVENPALYLTAQLGLICDHRLQNEQNVPDCCILVYLGRTFAVCSAFLVLHLKVFYFLFHSDVSTTVFLCQYALDCIKYRAEIEFARSFSEHRQKYKMKTQGKCTLFNCPQK